MADIKIDVVIGLQMGDEGKAATVYNLAKKNDYNYTVRFNGSGNAGHTFYHEGKKLATHAIPTAISLGVPSVIGRGCVVNPVNLKREIEYLEDHGIKANSLLKIDGNAHIVTPEHLEEDGKDTKIGTTKQGNGQAYRDKYARTGYRMYEISKIYPELSKYFESKLTDTYKLFYSGHKPTKILCEGAQAFFLDPDWGEYPYVTSSHCGIGSVFLNGFNHTQINRVYGVAKAYETYVGTSKFDITEYDPSKKEIVEQICELGHEYGTTTGRRRQINWINLDKLKQAVEINGVTDLIVRKIDILDKVNHYEIKDVGTFRDADEFKSYVKKQLTYSYANNIKSIHWSTSPIDF